MLDVSRDPERIRDYLAGRLSEEENHAFGERLIRDPGLVRELERTLQMREGLQQLQEQQKFGAMRGRQRRVWLPALAAAATVAIIAVSLWVRTGTDTSVLGATLASRFATNATPEITARFTFVQMRGGAVPALALPARGAIEFRAQPATADAASGYRVTLLREMGSEVEPRGSAVVPAIGADGYLHVYADAARLEPGRYVLRVQDAGQLAAELMFPFDFRTAAAEPSP
jgi:hypothetical protein